MSTELPPLLRESVLPWWLVECEYHHKLTFSCGICFRFKRPCVLCSTTNTSDHRPHCHSCFTSLNPDFIPSRINFHRKEIHLRLCLVRDIPWSFVYNKPVRRRGHARYRPDFLFDFETHSVIVENDEHQHLSYPCEDDRMITLYTQLGKKPLIMLRFNPDWYVDDELRLVPGAFEYNNQGVLCVNETEWDRRWDCLKSRLLSLISSRSCVPTKPLTVEYLFYSKGTATDREITPVLPQIPGDECELVCAIVLRLLLDNVMQKVNSIANGTLNTPLPTTQQQPPPTPPRKRHLPPWWRKRKKPEVDM